MGLNLQDKDNLHHGRSNLQEGWNSPGPVGRDGHCPQADGSGDDLADEVRRIEQRGQNGSFLGVSQFAEKGRSRNDTKGNSEAKDDPRDDVHANYGINKWI